MQGLSLLFYLVLLAQVVLFLLFFKRPVWAIGSLIVGQLTVSSFQFTVAGLPMSLRLFWAMMAILLLVPFLMYHRKKLELGGRARYVVIPAIMFFGLATVSNLINTDLYTSLRYLREPVTALAILVLVPAAVRDEGDLKRISVVALVTVAASAAVALLQYFTSSSLVAGMAPGERVSGLSGAAFYIGYMFPVVMLPMVSLVFVRGIASRGNLVLVFLFAVMAAALYLSYTRTGIYSLAAGVVIMGLHMERKPRTQLLLTSVVAFAVFFAAVFVAGNRYVQGFTQEESAASRLVLWQAAFNIASDHPFFGIGVGTFANVSREYASTISPEAMQNLDAGSVLGQYQAHNDFLTIWSSFGAFALLCYIVLSINIYFNLAAAYRNSRTRFSKGFAIGCIGALVALLVNAVFHNVMDSSMLLWIVGGLSVAAFKVASSPRLVKAEEASTERPRR
jgi:O-antigen ligase